jgi:hypothetical protein
MNKKPAVFTKKRGERKKGETEQTKKFHKNIKNKI